MMHLKLIVHSMLVMPAIRETESHYIITFCVMAYLSIFFLVLKTFQYNKDRFEN
jgi:hypothetical protein